MRNSQVTMDIYRYLQKSLAEVEEQVDEGNVLLLVTGWTKKRHDQNELNDLWSV